MNNDEIGTVEVWESTLRAWMRSVDERLADFERRLAALEGFAKTKGAGV